MERLIESIKKQLKESAPTERLSDRARLLSKPYKSLGVPLKQIRETVSKVYKESKKINHGDHIDAVEDLLNRDLYEDKMLAIFLLGESVRDKQTPDFIFLERLIDLYIDDWSLCDTFATEVIAPSLQTDWNTGQRKVIEWPYSQNEWVRRCVLVGTIKCKDKVSDWEEFSQNLLTEFKGENERIVKKAVLWLERQLKS
jgi:3-methyladenine DNA glycosylase AlkD